MTSFDQLHILNLHGNSLKKEQCPDGSKDENVFDIRQGVAIILAVKHNGIPTGVWYSDLWGDRDAKYCMLGNGQMAQTVWQELSPRSDTYFLSPQDVTLADQYEQWPRVVDLFLEKSTGIKTHRDHFAVALDREQIVRRLTDMGNVDLSDEELRERYDLADNRDWQLPAARQRLHNVGDQWRSIIQPCAYRPFDVRWCCFDEAAMDYPRRDIMQHMLKPNVALCVGRAGQVVGNDAPWNVCWCSDCIEDFNLFYRGGNVNLPLYTYESTGAVATSSLLIDVASSEKPTRTSNLRPEAWEAIPDFMDATALPEQLFAYVYAILCSPAYRERYAEFLRVDFPRVPFTKNRDTFLKLAELGQQLIDLHLMRSPELDNPISRFCGKGNSDVTKVEYDADRGRVRINPTQYFDGITPDLWTYQIGGYQVLSKWLKDRKGRFLTSADTIYYSRIVTALSRTVVVQSQIDVAVQASELFVLQ